MPKKYVDGELVEITDKEMQEENAFWEHGRDADGNPERRKVAPDGTVLVDWESAPEEWVAERERKEDRETEQDNLQTAISNALNSAPGEEIVKILVAKGVLTVEEAENAGADIG